MKETACHNNNESLFAYISSVLSGSGATWTQNKIKGSEALYTRGFCPWRTPIGLALPDGVADADALRVEVDIDFEGKGGLVDDLG